MAHIKGLFACGAASTCTSCSVQAASYGGADNSDPGELFLALAEVSQCPAFCAQRPVRMSEAYANFTKTFCGSYGYAAPEVNPKRQAWLRSLASSVSSCFLAQLAFRVFLTVVPGFSRSLSLDLLDFCFSQCLCFPHGCFFRLFPHLFFLLSVDFLVLLCFAACFLSSLLPVLACCLSSLLSSSFFLSLFFVHYSLSLSQVVSVSLAASVFLLLSCVGQRGK